MIWLLNKFFFSLPPPPGVWGCFFVVVVLLKVLQCYVLPTVLKNWYGSFQEAILHEILPVKKWKQLIAEAAMYITSDGLKNSIYKSTYRR